MKSLVDYFVKKMILYFICQPISSWIIYQFILVKYLQFNVKNLGLKILLTSPYSPELNPIEL